jgi:menaquinone-dependent protoporphyrinogen IX oxidase
MSNNKTAVVYRSKSGYTKNYAEWISQSLSCDLIEASEIKTNDLASYSTIIYGGGLYAGGIHGMRKFLKMMDKAPDTTLIVFAVGATPARKATTDELFTLNFTPEQQKKISFFYLRGGFEYARLTPIDKILMELLKIKLKRTKDPTPDNKGMLAAYEHPVDFTKKDKIAPIVTYVKEKMMSTNGLTV